MTTAPAASVVPVMEGSLEQFDLSEILQVVGIGRQYTGIELLAQDHTRAGTIYIKSGKVLQVRTATLSGKDALFCLFRIRPSFFNVFRVETPLPSTEPIGSVRSLLMEVWESGDVLESEGSSQLDPEAFRVEASASPQDVTVVGPGPQLTVGANGNGSADARRAPAPVASSSTNAMRPPPPLGADGVAKLPRLPELHERSSGHRAVKPSGEIGPPYVVAVASPKGGSGKTTVALNLALSLARQEQRVILVDGDINGDLLSAIDERASARVGVFDVLLGSSKIEEALRSTVHSHLRIVPAVGVNMPGADVTYSNHTARWRSLLTSLSERADIVLVDTPAGMFGVTHQIMAACTHVIGVQQAEVIATRSFSMFVEGLRALPNAQRPRVLGVFLNMLQVTRPESVDVLQELCRKLPRSWLFETSIPRNAAFLEAAAAGVPLHLLDDKHPPAVTWLFDTLASEVIDRLDLEPGERGERKRLLA